jgi:hypothetical protein
MFAMKNGWSPNQYTLYRAAFGVYLAIHFAMLIPFGTELFSNQGVLPDAYASPLAFLFPNILCVADSPAVVLTMLVTGVIAAMFFAAGRFDRTAAVTLWYVLACAFGRNPLIANPSLPYVGWLLLAHLAVPPVRQRDWVMPGNLFGAAWIVMAAGYTYSGWTKLASPSWLDGTALERLLSNPLARPTALRDLLLTLPSALLTGATWLTLALELMYAPLALSRRARPWIWLAMLGLHLSLLVIVDFADLTLGMVMLHFFTFDRAWLRFARPVEDSPSCLSLSSTPV